MTAVAVNDIELSASRIKTLDTCQLKYSYQYVQRIPSVEESGAMMFGSAVHNGVELWYASGKYQRDDLAKYVERSWDKLLPNPLKSPMRASVAAGAAADALIQAIHISRPDIKAPAQTKDYLNSPEVKRTKDCYDTMMAAIAKDGTTRWAKDEDPYRAFKRSLDIAAKLQARWQHRPEPLVVEKRFNIEFAGLHINGFIDQIRLDPDPNGEVHPEMVDMKTGRQIMTQMEMFVQSYLYYEACIEDPTLPTPDWINFLQLRHDFSQIAKPSRERHRKLAEQIVRSVRDRIMKVREGDNAPSYGFWCKSCDFRPLCEEAIGYWPVGGDTLVLGTP